MTYKTRDLLNCASTSAALVILLMMALLATGSLDIFAVGSLY